MLRYIFSHSVHNLTNAPSDDATLILVGRLFQTTTPEYEKRSCILLVVIGNFYVLLTVNWMLCCQGLYLSFETIHVNKLVLNYC